MILLTARHLFREDCGFRTVRNQDSQQSTIDDLMRTEEASGIGGFAPLPRVRPETQWATSTRDSRHWYLINATRARQKQTTASGFRHSGHQRPANAERPTPSSWLPVAGSHAAGGRRLWFRVIRVEVFRVQRGLNAANKNVSPILELQGERSCWSFGSVDEL